MRNPILLLFILSLFSVNLSAQVHMVQMVDNEFVPEDLTIEEGDTVLWVNDGSAVHTTTSGTNCTSDGTWDSGSMDPNDEFMFVFENSGDFPYFCIPHCGIEMTGSISVDAVSSAKEANAFSFEIYPNPVSDKLNLDLTSLEESNVTVQIMDIQGKQMEEFRNLRANSVQTISLNDLGVGIYIITLRAGNKSLASRRFLKVE